MQFRSRPRRKVFLNITSLIDVLFLLLIFLMVSTTFLEQPGIKLELPEAQSAAIIEQKGFTLFVNKAGTIFLNDTEIAIEDLEAKIKEVLPKMKKSTIILKADQDLSHGLVVRLMDIVKKSGVKKLVIGTKLK
ncbi:MAG: biopolymer transporter ExbD [Candidatus Aminicenantes bacterium]|nr:biopolymer transporter ExbD [Candidatus Aminicenantes bacterium]